MCGPTMLVIAPTRELAVQIKEEADKFGRSAGISNTCGTLGRALLAANMLLLPTCEQGSLRGALAGWLDDTLLQPKC